MSFSCHNRSVIFQTAETAVPCALFQQILAAIAALRLLPQADVEDWRQTGPVWPSAGDVRPDIG